MTRGEAIKQFLTKSILPTAVTFLLVYIFQSSCMRDGELDYMWLWVLCGTPFGFHTMCLLIIHGGNSFGGGIAFAAFGLVISGIIGCFVLVWRLLVAAWYVPLTIYRLFVV